MTRTLVPLPSLAWLATTLLFINYAPGKAFADDVIVHRVAGTGMALEAMRLLGEDFSVVETNIQWVILPSLGTPGGIRALLENETEIAVAARRPTADEAAKGVQAAACFRTALVFASSHRHPSGITAADLPDLFTSLDRKWPDGVPIKVILRARAGSEYGYLSNAIPALGPALEAAHKRPGMPVGVTDQQNAELAVKTAGSLAVTSLLQIRAERLDLRVLALDGIVATAETLDDNSYPLPVPICILTMLNRLPSVSKFVAYLQSPIAQRQLRSFGAILPK